MDESNKKARHGFVTFWLWASIIVNAFGLLRFNAITSNFTELDGIIVLLYMAVIFANILVLKWKIIGFFIICAGVIALLLLMIFYFRIETVPSILFGVLLLSIYFGILNIRKNGISLWKHLLNEAKTNKRETKIWFAGVFGTIILFFVVFLLSL